MNNICAAPLRILVTGAAGLIGRELCAVLADRGHAVAALVHRSRTLARNDGTPLALRSWDGAFLPGTIAVVAGDVAESQLGLPPVAAAALSQGLDLIVHCAAVTGFALPPATYARVNAGGTAAVLAFAAQGGPRGSQAVLHVSTAYVCGDADGTIPESQVHAPRFNNGYEASKAAGEALVLAAHASGQRCAVARPSIVVGRSSDGVIGEFGNLYQLIRVVTEGRVRQLPAAPNASLDMVPIDHVVGALVDIAERMDQADGQIFHLVSGHPVPVAALRPLAQAFPHLDAPSFVDPATFDPTRLTPRERRMNAQVTERYACYLRRDPRFVTANLRALSGRTCPATDDAFLRRMIAHGIAAGFLRSPDDAGATLSARAGRTGPGFAVPPMPSAR